MRRLVLKALVAIAAMAASSFVAGYACRAAIAAGHRRRRHGRRHLGAGRDRARRRRDPAYLRGRRSAMRSSASATSTRRIGCGRWSSSGASAMAACPKFSARPLLPQDRFLRTVGFGRAARSAWERLPRVAREQVNAYVAGVNAFIAAHHGSALPPEFTLLRFEPEPCHRPRCGGVGEDDGVGSERQLHVRAPAPRPHRTRRQQSGCRSAHAAVSDTWA